MQQIIKILIGISFLALGFPVGDFLANKTKDELKLGQKWFKIIIIVSLIGGLMSLILRNDSLFFSFLFIAIVTSRSLKPKIQKRK